MKQFDLHKMLRLSLLTAAQVVLSRFCSISTPVVKLGLGFLPVAVAANAYGITGGVIVGVLSDLLGALLFPQGAFFIGYTVGALVTGILYGAFFHGRPPFRRILVGYALTGIVVTLGINSFSVALQYGYLLTETHDPASILPFYFSHFMKRLIEYAIMLPIQVAVTYPVLKHSKY